MTTGIGNVQLRLLERLCNAVAPSSDETEVRNIVIEETRSLADEIKVDPLGNVLVTRKGTARNRPRVMLAAHMDEIGFILTVDEGEGIFRFEVMGGIDPRQLAGKMVWVGREHVPGVIGARPIHLATKEELNKKIPAANLRIDLGLNGAGVKTGDYATFATPFQRNGQVIIAKALDDRLGVATLIELIKHASPNIDLLAAFTVQEEIGRGAGVAAHALDPDMAFVIDSTPAMDLPSWDGEENLSYNTKLDRGPAIYVADSATLSDPRLIRFLIQTAEAEGIPYQLRQPGSGGTDAGAIHLRKTGIPSVSVSVPGRYPHTAVGLVHLDDWKNTLALLQIALQRITPEILTQERA